MKPSKLPDKHKPHLRIYGLTGTIGAGKSAVAEMFRSLGAKIIDADILAREVVKPGRPELAKIVDSFGPAILKPEGELDRKKLAQLIFNSETLRKKLENILHPAIRKLYLAELASIEGSESKFNRPVIYVVPLLFESGFDYAELSGSILVTAAPETCLERIMQRDGTSRELAQKKLAAQMPSVEKEKLATYIIRNDSTLTKLQEEVMVVWQKIQP